MTKPFSPAFKQKMVERLTGRDAMSARQLAEEMSLRQQTLSRWLQEAHTLPLMSTKKKSKKAWTVGDKARVLTEASKLRGDNLLDYLGREGISLAELEQWRLALDEGASISTMRRIRALERELVRKEKALAEAAALLVLKKKVEVLWEDEDDSTGEENEK